MKIKKFNELNEDIHDQYMEDGTYVHPELKKYVEQLIKIKDELLSINSDLENTAPVDEDIYDATDALDKVIKKAMLR